MPSPLLHPQSAYVHCPPLQFSRCFSPIRVLASDEQVTIPIRTAQQHYQEKRVTEAALFLPGTGQKESLTACCPTTERQRYYFCPYHHQTYSQSTAACSSGAPERQKPPRTPRRAQIRELVLQSLSLTLVSKSTRKWCLCVGGVGNESQRSSTLTKIRNTSSKSKAAGLVSCCY